MTEPIKYDPRIHVIVPRVATDKMLDSGYTPPFYGYGKMLWDKMIAAAPPITIEGTEHE